MASVDKKEKVKIVCILHSCLTICLLMVCRKKNKRGIFPLVRMDFLTIINVELLCCPLNKALESPVKPLRVTILGLSLNTTSIAKR